MKAALESLYRELGVKGRLDDPSPFAAVREALSVAGASLDAGSPIDDTVAKVLGEVMERDPGALLEIVQRTVKADVSEVELRQAVTKARAALRNPEIFAESMRSSRVELENACPPPADLPVYDGIPVTPCSRQYEAKGDLVGWVVNCGGYWLLQKAGLLRRARFPEHTAANNFTYKMTLPNGDPVGDTDTVSVALFSDFATGTYGSRYVAKHLEVLHPAYAIHLGDTYYAGTWAEIAQNLEGPLTPLLPGTRVFVMNGNHEMLSGGHAYFDFIQRKRQSYPSVQEQEGSYFCLHSPHWQIIGIDTAYDYQHDGRHLSTPLGEWLRDRLAEGRAAGRRNILLSQHEPFDLGATGPRDLFHDIKAYARDDGGHWMFDFWFWGDEHYAALFQPGANAPFVSSCIGNGGFPVDLRDLHKREKADRIGNPFAKAAWVDLSPRFSTLRTDDLGNTGYCVLELAPETLTITYHDWLGRIIHTVSF